jgi:hypothetical protein
MRYPIIIMRESDANKIMKDGIFSTEFGVFVGLFILKNILVLSFSFAIVASRAWKLEENMANQMNSSCHHSF